MEGHSESESPPKVYQSKWKDGWNFLKRVSRRYAAEWSESEDREERNGDEVRERRRHEGESAETKRSIHSFKPGDDAQKRPGKRRARFVASRLSR